MFEAISAVCSFSRLRPVPGCLPPLNHSPPATTGTLRVTTSPRRRDVIRKQFRAKPATRSSSQLRSINGPIKATSGGWARDVTTKSLPIATDIAGAHLYLNAGGVREMHWHTSAEWAYILSGHCQVTVVDPEGETEVANYGPGDLWFFVPG